VSQWLKRQLAPAERVASGLVVVTDIDGLLDPRSVTGEAEIVDNWWELRSTYERRGRRRPTGEPPLVLVVRPPLAREPLPWDIERAAAARITIKLPGPPEVRAALRELDDDELDRVVPIVATAVDPARAAVEAVTGVVATADAPPPADQLRIATRLALRSTPATRLVDIARRWVSDPVIAGLLDVPPAPGRLQQCWNEFVAGSGADWRQVFAQAKPELAALFAAGVLEPAAGPAPLDGWARVGVRRPSHEERARDLLDASPVAAPADLASWYGVAEWWSDLRRLTAHGPTDLRDAAWTAWAELDAAFSCWLRERYGMLLTSAAAWPVAVHRIAPFLARRVREGAADRVLLIVLDGLGHTQWSYLREGLAIEVLEAGSVCALVPTYTTVSRQAIFAGELPLSSPDTLWTTQPEPRRWSELWAAEGIPVTGVVYYRVKGRLPHDQLGFGDAPVIGVVVNAVDDLMHSSELFGDAQLLANLDVWADNGFLVDLVGRATAAGIETWITADHGNVECLGIGTVSEGIAIEAAGKRLLRYPNKTLRDASAAQGTVWDDIPGLPSTAGPLLFATGRTAFTNNRISVSHGGLSLDEVIVPLARVVA
jgi:hypothetical protein